MVRTLVKVPIKATANTEKALSGLKRKAEKLESEFRKAFAIEVRRALTDKDIVMGLISGAEEVLMNLQEGYFSGAGANGDPTQFKFYTEYLTAEVIKNLQIAASTVDPHTGSFSFTLLTDDFMGIGSEGDTTGNAPIQWLTYFMTGTLQTNLVWLTSEELRKLNFTKGGSLGRFGSGFMISATSEEFITALEKVTGRNRGGTLFHPQSGKPGTASAQFREMLTSFNIKSRIRSKAVRAAKSRVILSNIN